MALSIGELVGYVSLDASGAKRGAATAQAAVNGVQTSLDKTSEHGSGFGAALAKGVKFAAVGLFGLGAVGAKMGLQTAAGLEQAKIAFSTMLGSASKADRFLRKLAAFAAATPFEFPELQEAASSLISAGINANKVIPIMRTLGDVTSGMGTGSDGVQRATIALQQMNAAGRITGEDLNQLRDAGIPVYDLLAKATGKSKAEVVKLAQAGKLGHKELGQMMKALETGKGLERFSGLMAKQSKSLTGQWSTFTDTLNMGLAKAIQPIIPLLKDGMGKASAYLAVVLPKVANALRTFVQGIHDGTGAGGKFRAILTQLVTTVAAVVAWAIKWQNVLVPVLAGIGAIVAVVKVWRSVTMAYTAAQAALNIVLTANPIGLLILAIAGLVAGLVVAYKKSDTFRAVVNGAFTGIQKVAGPVLSWLSKAVRSTIDFVRAHWRLIVSIIGGPLVAAVVLIATHWKKAKAITSAAWGVIKAVVTTYTHGVLAVIGALASIPGKVSGWFGRAKAAAVTKLVALVTWVQGVPGRITAALGDLRSLLTGAGRAVIQGLIDGVQSMVKPLTDKLHAITKLFPKHKGPASKDKKLLRPNGRMIIEGLMAGLKDRTGNLIKLLHGVTAHFSKAQFTNLDKAVAATYKRGLALAKARDIVAKRLKKAGDRLADAISTRDDFRAAVTSSVRDYASIANAEGTGAAALIADMAAKVAQAEKFRENLQTLLSEGLDLSSYQELVDKGVEGAGATVQALVDGGPAAVAQVAALSAQLSTSADLLGKQTSTTLYQAGVDSAQALVDGLSAKSDKLDKAADRIAKLLATKVKHALEGVLLHAGNGTRGSGGKGASNRVTASSGKPKKPKKPKPSKPKDGRRGAPLIGTVVQRNGQSADELAESLWYKTRKRG